MSHLTMNEPAVITGRPHVNLVDIDGNPVPDCERYTPTCPPDPTDPAEWPAWTDNWHYGTAEDEDLAATAEDMASEVYPDAPDDPAFYGPSRMTPAEADALYAEDLARDALALGIMPIAGGAPDDDPEPFVPTDEDWRDYARHREWEEMNLAIRAAESGDDPDMPWNV